MTPGEIGFRGQPQYYRPVLHYAEVVKSCMKYLTTIIRIPDDF